MEFIPDDLMYRGPDEPICTECGNPVDKELLSDDGLCPTCKNVELRKLQGIEFRVRELTPHERILIDTPHGLLCICFLEDELDTISVVLMNTHDHDVKVEFIDDEVLSISRDEEDVANGDVS